MLKRYAALVAFAVSVMVAAPGAQKAAAPSKVTQPKDEFGFAIGDDYRLVNYTQFTNYVKKLQAQSERMTVVDIGKTEEGRTEFTAIITSPENQRKLPLIKAANRSPRARREPDRRAGADAGAREQDRGVDRRRPARHRGARRAAADRDDLPPEHPQRIRRRCGSSTTWSSWCTLVNPDGMELVSDWYMREADEKKRSTSGIPRLYQKYIGHDDNRANKDLARIKVECNFDRLARLHIFEVLLEICCEQIAVCIRDKGGDPADPKCASHHSRADLKVDDMTVLRRGQSGIIQIVARQLKLRFHVGDCRVDTVNFGFVLQMWHVRVGPRLHRW